MSHFWCLDDPSIHEPTNDQLTGRVWHGRFVLDGVIYGKKDVLLRRDKMSQQDKMHQCHIFFYGKMKLLVRLPKMSRRDEMCQDKMSQLWEK